MSRSLLACGLASLLVFSGRASAQDDPPPERAAKAINSELEAQREAAAAKGLVSDAAANDSTPNPASALLVLPERLLEAMFLPVGALLVVSERHQIPKRVGDFLQNDAETIVVSPKLKFSTGQGLGLGAALKLQSRLASEAQLRFSGLIELDGDFEFGVRTERRVARLDGRRISLSVDYEKERGNDYFGIGDDTLLEDRRELGIDDIRALLTTEINSRASETFYGTGHIGFLRQRLYPGQGSAMPLEEMGMVAVPQSFGLTRNYAAAGLETRYDTRDTEGRTSTGVLLAASGKFTLDVGDVNVNAVTATASGALFLPIAGRSRTLVLSMGIGVAESVTGDPEEIPLDALVVLGRNNHLSGYRKSRFRATRTVWGHGEYRYPIWYLSSHPIVLTSRLFVDIGREGDNFDDLIETPVRSSFGTGFVVELYHSTVTGAQIAFSPEGFEVIFSAGTPL